MKHIGMIIINYNDSTNAIKLAKSVLKYKSLDEIVIVDNHSTDHSVDNLDKLNEEKVTIMELEQNLGYSGAINEASKYLVEKYININIIISNTDIIIPDEKVVTELSNMINDKVKCVMPKVMEHNTINYGWRLTNSHQDFLLNIPLINRLYRNKMIYYPNSYFNGRNARIDCIYGCFFMVDGKTFQEINYLDDHLFLYYEEYVLARKLKDKKLASMINLDVEVVHEHNATIGTNVSKLNKYKIYKRSWLYYEKHYNHANWLQMGCFYIFYYLDLIYLKNKAIIKK